MKKQLILFMMMIILKSIVFSQNLEIFSKNLFDTHYVSLPKNGFVKLPTNIICIDVIDARPDSLCMGFMQDFLFKSIANSTTAPEKFVSIRFKQAFDKEWNECFKNQIGYQNKDGYKLTIAIKDFIFSEVPQIQNKNDNSKDAFYRGCILIRADIYLQKDSLSIPLYQVETVLKENGFLKSVLNKLFISAFNTLIEKLPEFDLTTITQKATRFKNKLDLNKYYSNLYNYPIFNAYLNPVKGFFRTYEDFKMNKTDTSFYLVHYGKQTDDIYIKENNTDVLIKPYAICDGVNYKIYSQLNLFQLAVYQKRFYFFGSKYSVVNKTTGFFSGLPDYKIKMYYEPIIIDLTGNGWMY